MAIKRICWFISLVWFSIAGTMAQTVQISIGEQPPLFSSKGGIIDIVVKESLARSGYTVQFNWYPVGRMLKILELNQAELYVTPSNTAGQQNPHVDLLAARAEGNAC